MNVPRILSLGPWLRGQSTPPSTPRTFAGTITGTPTATDFPKPMGVQRAEAATATIRRAHLTLCHGGLYGRRPTTLRATLHPKTHPTKPLSLFHTPRHA